MSKWIIAGWAAITLGTAFMTVGMYIDFDGTVWVVPIFVYLIFVGFACFVKEL